MIFFTMCDSQAMSMRMGQAQSELLDCETEA